MNATQSLRRHDWIHRWETILTTLGFEILAESSCARRAAGTGG